MDEFLERLAPVWTPHDGQREFLTHPAKFKVLACGRRWGKTDASAVQIVHALHRPWPTKHLILAPTADQAALVFDRAVQLLDRLVGALLAPSVPSTSSGTPPPLEGTDFPQTGEDRDRPAVKSHLKRSPYPLLKFGPHTVMARSGHLPRALRGHEATHIVVDEAAYLPESLVTEVALPMLATTDGFLTLISTPHGKNHFWRFFEMGQRGENGVWSRQAPSSESPYVSDSFLAVQRELISERAFTVEYEAQFVDSAGQVFRTDAVQRCLAASLPPLVGTCAIGIDWARYGDYTAVAVLDGHREAASLRHIEKFQGLAWNEAVRRVAEVVDRFPGARVVCDATGVGDPVLDMLRARLPGRPIEGLVFTPTVKAGLVDNLAWLIEKQALAMLPDPQLLRELEHFEARTSDTGHTKLSARGGYHDDLVVALALAAQGLAKNYRSNIAIGGPRRFSR